MKGKEKVMNDNTNNNDQEIHNWQENIITLFEQLSNFAFYTFAFLIILLPTLKWIVGIFPSTNNIWWVIASVAVFVIIIPAITPLIADISFVFLEKMRKGEILSVIFKPLKSIFAVVSIFGVLVLEYKVIHGKTDKTLFEVFYELLKSL